ncbi:hypothetical protein KM043_012021 [Ampulex compressa]|nr:hypothetical protein KM043_012021 [Ampulex compressa]
MQIREFKEEFTGLIDRAAWRNKEKNSGATNTTTSTTIIPTKTIPMPQQRSFKNHNSPNTKTHHPLLRGKITNLRHNFQPPIAVPDTLEEFKLMLYGTETIQDLDEELDKDKPVPPVNHQDVGQDNRGSGGTRPNVLDTDPWTGSQQVERVSHPEVQRPTTENQTSGCGSLESGRCLGGCLILLLVAYLLAAASASGRGEIVLEPRSGSPW